jgi:hypothetical protein
MARQVSEGDAQARRPQVEAAVRKAVRGKLLRDAAYAATLLQAVDRKSNNMHVRTRDNEDRVFLPEETTVMVRPNVASVKRIPKIFHMPRHLRLATQSDSKKGLLKIKYRTVKQIFRTPDTNLIPTDAVVPQWRRTHDSRAASLSTTMIADIEEHLRIRPDSAWSPPLSARSVSVVTPPADEPMTASSSALADNNGFFPSSLPPDSGEPMYYADKEVNADDDDESSCSYLSGQRGCAGEAALSTPAGSNQGSVGIPAACDISPTTTTTRFADIVGQTQAKLHLKELLLPFLLPAHITARIFVGPRAQPASVLLYGPPGCGKVSSIPCVDQLPARVWTHHALSDTTGPRSGWRTAGGLLSDSTE